MRRPFANSRNIRIPPVPQSGGAPPTPGIVTDGLELHLDAGDASSYSGTGLDWVDLITGTQTFTFNATPRFDSDQGYFNFNGNNWAQSTYTTPLAPTRGAVEMWFRWKSQSPITSAVVLTGTGNWYALGHVTGSLPDESIEFNSGVAAVMDDQQGHTYYRDNNWHQMVAVVDGVANTLYVDGVPVATTFRSGNATSTGLISLATTYIGRYIGAGYYFDGDIAIVRVYDTGADSFSAADVAQNYAAQSPRFSSFRPDSINSLSLWVDPSDDTTITYGTGTEIVEILDKANIVDRASFKAPSGSPNGPNILTDGGINWMQFAASDSLHGKKVAGANALLRSDVFSSNNYEMHVVLKPTALPSLSNANPWTNNIVGPSDSSGYWGLYIKDVGGVPFVQPYNYSTNSTYGGFALSVNDKAIAGHSKPGGTADVTNYKDGVALSPTLASVASLGGGSGALEFSGSGQDYIGLIGEVCVFSSELSSSDRSDLIDYLKTKWSI